MKSKKGLALAIKPIGLIIIGIAVYFLFFSNSSIASIGQGDITNIFQTSTPETSNLPTIETTENLCSVFAPVIALGNLQSECISQGGTWICAEDRVGCIGATAGIITCSGPGFDYAYSECTGAGADYLCNSNNALCYYPPLY